jgi:4-hydroxybenzoate polyprenyltransferase
LGRFLRLARITAWPAYSLAFVVPFAAGVREPTSWFKASAGFLALFMFAAFAFALNFYSDRDTDRLHDGKQKDFDLGQQPMVIGEVSDGECRVFCLATFLSAIGLGFVVSGVFAALVSLACLIGGILYSHPRIRLKAKPVGDVICMSVLGVIIPSAGFLLGFGELPTGLMMLLWFFVTATGYVASVMSDFEFDRKAGLRTTAVWLGQVGGLKAMLVGSLISLTVAGLIFRGYYPVGTRYFAGLSAVGVVALTALVWRFLQPPRMQLPVVSRGRWIFPAFGLVSAVCLCYVCLKLYLPDYLPWDPFTAL